MACVTRETREGWGSEEPIYNIGAVARMIGVPETTLRVWEQRYGFPKPARTAGGHRLYSEGQARRVLWIKAQINNGMQTRQAIRALQSLEQASHVPESPLTFQVMGQQQGAYTPLTACQESLMAALLAHDLEKADWVLAEKLALYSLEDLILDVIRPTLADIGCAWLEGRATAATEHFATYYLRHRLLMWMLGGPRPHPVRPIVLACAPGEWHEGGLLILGVLLRRRRWPVAYLGQSVPLPDLAAFVQEVRPPVVVLVAMTEEPAEALLEWPRWFPEAARNGRPLIAFGGLVFTEQDEWQDRTPGKFLGSTLQEGVETLDRLMCDDAALTP